MHLHQVIQPTKQPFEVSRQSFSITFPLHCALFSLSLSTMVWPIEGWAATCQKQHIVVFSMVNVSQHHTSLKKNGTLVIHMDSYGLLPGEQLLIWLVAWPKASGGWVLQEAKGHCFFVERRRLMITMGTSSYSMGCLSCDLSVMVCFSSLLKNIFWYSVKIHSSLLLWKFIFGMLPFFVVSARILPPATSCSLNTIKKPIVLYQTQHEEQGISSLLDHAKS